MTKKYWKDWQQRIGETENIYLFSKYHSNARYGHYVLNTGDALVKAMFHENTVNLVIERHRIVFDYRARSLRQNVENEYLTLHREEIVRIDFKKYY